MPKPKAPTPAQDVAPIKVRATKAGYYEHLIRREGDVFEIRGDVYPKDVTKVWTDKAGNTQVIVLHHAGEVIEFSEQWMERTSAKAPLTQSTTNDELRRQHDEILSARVDTPSGAASVLD